MLAVGMGIVLLACTLLVAGILGLGASFAVFPEPTPDVELVTSGIYGRARHPIFGGWILVGLGFGVAFSPWALPLSGILALELLGKTSVEERHLTVQYPAYVEYRRQVPRRFFPVPTWK
jgi:protein-S-isoprenylcysteine O-methyltransferase Ste14